MARRKMARHFGIEIEDDEERALVLCVPRQGLRGITRSGA